MKNKVNFSLFIIINICFMSCSWTRLGTLTMMSTRNVDSKTEYVELARYVDSESKEAKKMLKNTSSESGKKLDMAVDRCVATVPGGEFMKNVQIYAQGSNVKVIGDVWGKSSGFSYTVEQQRMQNEKAAKDSLERQKQMKTELRKNELEQKKQQKIEDQQKLADSFSIGDKVTWNEMGKYLTGEIIGKDESNAAIKFNDKYGKEKIKRVRFQSLTKIVK